MYNSYMTYLLTGVVLYISLATLPLQSQAASQSYSGITAQVDKERLVLMPLRLEDETKKLQGALDTALVEGLQQKYAVFSGEQVAQKAREVFLKESRNTEHTECDETKC